MHFVLIFPRSSPSPFARRRNFAVLCLMLTAQEWPFWTALALGSYYNGLRYTLSAQTEKVFCLRQIGYQYSIIRFKHHPLCHRHTNIQHAWAQASLHIQKIYNVKFCESPYTVSVVSYLMLCTTVIHGIPQLESNILYDQTFRCQDWACFLRTSPILPVFSMCGHTLYYILHSTVQKSNVP